MAHALERGHSGAVWVTGAGTGIGLETALRFGHAGWRVYAGARNPAASAGLQAGIAASG